MKNTKERHIIEEHFENEAEYYGHLVHIISYHFALDFAENKEVLDFGCGTGYGSKILSQKASYIIGADISDEAIIYANKNYKSKNLLFINIQDLNKEKYYQKFELITSFQVIEHVMDEVNFIKTILWLLKPNGHFIITTPNKKNRLYHYIQKPWNKFHIKEYNESELNNLLNKYFEDVKMLNISANNEFVNYEINRLKKQRIITLPFTLLIFPKCLSNILLKLQKNIFLVLNKIKKQLLKEKNRSIKNEFNSKFTINDMIIEEKLNVFTDLLCVCKNKT